MKEYKGAFLKEEEEIFDPALIELLGHRYRDNTLEPPAQDEPEADGDAEKAAGIWEKLKKPLLFATLVAIIGTSAHLGLMDALVAVPGMCVCSACFGWNVGRYHG